MPFVPLHFLFSDLDLVGIALRSASHRFHPILQLLFYILVFLGWLFSALYSNLTPDLYEHQKHSSMGYFVLILVVAIAIVDAVAFVRRFVSFMRSTTQPTLAAACFSFCKDLVTGLPKGNPYGSYSPTNEYSNLAQGPEAYDSRDQDHFDDVDLAHSHDQDDDLEKPDSQSRRPNLFRLSYASDLSATPTLREDASFISPSASPISRTFNPNPSFWGSVCANVVYLAEWALIVLGYTLLLSGGVVYTGICREGYLNGCLAHLISASLLFFFSRPCLTPFSPEGSIFFLYGVFTFCRYLGAFAKFGWAWNRVPDAEHGHRKPRVHTAEMTECALIFTYGITNTWLERTGAAPGAPYTTKEIQHISIAVMFWFAGIVGMGLESKRVRRLLALSAFSAPSSQATVEPATYTGSFNPFPALVIGVTGAAMAAHHQVYLFAIQVHALWGNLLVAAAVMRCLTYLFLWLKPPTAERSVLPSRPPTEALAAFALVCGGLVFIASTEQIVFASMRHGRGEGFTDSLG
jgi:Protein YTP1-like, C-terminal/Domain of unknown function (DUF2427)